MDTSSNQDQVTKDSSVHSDSSGVYSGQDIGRRDVSQLAQSNQNVPSLPNLESQISIPVESESEPRHSIPFIIKIFIGFIFIGITGFILLEIFSHFSNNSQSGKVTLNYWGLWESKSVMDVIIADFERQYPNITVNYSMEDPKHYTDRLLTRIKNGTGPDIFRFHVSWMPMVFSSLAPLPSDVISNQEFKKLFYPVIQNDLIKNGGIYGIPLDIDTLALFTNTQLFQAAGVKIPTTWNDFITTARTITVKDETGKIKTAGAAMGTFDNITHAPDIVSLLLVQNGANLANLSETQQNASDALNFYNSFSKDQGNVWDNTLDPSIQAFTKGNLGMYFGYSWDIFAIKALNPNLQFSINPVPHLPGRNTTIASYWVEGVSNKGKHQKEAFLFMKFLSQKDTMQKLYAEEVKTRSFGELYPRIDLADGLKENSEIYPFLQQASDAKSTYFTGETEDGQFSAQMNGYLGNAVRAILGNTSPQSALDTLSKGEAQILQQYASSSQ